MGITISPRALEEIKKTYESEKRKNIGIRICAKGGGCSTTEFSMILDTEKHDHDKVYHIDNVTLYVDPKSHIYANNTFLDFSDQLLSEGFRFITHTE